MPLPRVGLEERGTPMLDTRTARILAKENEEDIEARRREEMAGHTQERASEWVPFFMMDMWMPVLLHL